MRRLPLLLLWIASLLLAGAVGAWLAPGSGEARVPLAAPPVSQTDPAPPRLGAPSASHARGEGGPDGSADGSSASATGSSRRGAMATGEGAPSAPRPDDGGPSLRERMQHLVLAGDVVGLLRAIDHAEEEDEGWLHEPESLSERSGRLLWNAWLLENQGQVVDLLEDLFERAAWRPASFPTDEVDGVTLGGVAAFDEFLAALPLLVPANRLARFRDLADRIRERERDLPAPVSDWDVYRYLEAWAEHTGAAEARVRLESGAWDTSEAYALLVAVGEEGRRELDLLPIRLRLLDARHWTQFRSVFLLAPPALREIPVLDAALLEALPPGPPALAWYLAWTGRGGWSEARPVLEHALDACPGSRSTILRALPALLEPPPADDVRVLLAHLEVDPHTAQYLRTVFHLK